MNQNLKLAAAALGGVVATLAAGGIAFASMDHRLGPIGPADLDNNGEVTRAEWLQAAAHSFDALDANRDGKLVVGEIPPPPHRHGRRGPPGGEGPDGPDSWDGPPPPPALAPAANAPAQPASSPQATPQPTR